MKKQLLAFACAAALAAPASAVEISLDFQTSLPSSEPGHHIDKAVVDSSLGIKELTAELFVAPIEGPLNQVQPGGQMTVFPDLLLPGDLDRDSHFLFDTSNATILFEFEDDFSLLVSVEFFGPLPTFFDLGQVVGLDSHSFVGAEISGTFSDGTSFLESRTVIPEPSTFLLFGFGMAFLFRGTRPRRAMEPVTRQPSLDQKGR